MAGLSFSFPVYVITEADSLDTHPTIPGMAKPKDDRRWAIATLSEGGQSLLLFSSQEAITRYLLREHGAALIPKYRSVELSRDGLIREVAEMMDQVPWFVLDPGSPGETPPLAMKELHRGLTHIQRN